MFVEQFYKNYEIRLAPKLTDCHVAPNNFKMKVRYATQVLSASQ